MLSFLALLIFLTLMPVQAATIAIIDTGFDLDHDFLKPKILKQETDEEALSPDLKDPHQWFHDNSHLKKAVIDDKSALQEVLLYRNLRAKGHREGLSLEEFEWFKRKSSDKLFMEMVKRFKKHSHGTFVAGIALREGENINIFPIRGLNLPSPVVGVEDSTPASTQPLKAKTPEERFREELQSSIDRVSKKFSKICNLVSRNKIEVVNASYGITYKNIVTKFRDRYREITGKEIDELRLKAHIDEYFAELYRRGKNTIKRHPKTLFIFSAGNSGINNDEYHHYPSKIKMPNTITVAAMNGEYLASFSNYGPAHVDVGAPGVAILSLIPKVYSENGGEMYSPSSGTSMAAPYISNLAAQILNTNARLSPGDVKKIILETGDEKLHLKTRLASAAIANNDKAIRAALFSKEMSLKEAINLAKSGLAPVEDKISIGMPPARPAEALKEKVMNAIPQVIRPEEIDEEVPMEDDSTKAESSSPKGPEKVLPGSSAPPSSAPQDAPVKSSDPVPSSQSAEPPPPPAADLPPSSSQSQPPLPEAQSPAADPSSPQ